jgi:hypothetical protein
MRTKADVGLGDRHLKKVNGTRIPTAHSPIATSSSASVERALFDKHLASTIHCVDEEIIGAAVA